MCALCTMLPTCIHPRLPVGWTVPQPTTYIHPQHPILPPSLTHFLPSFISFLPSPPCLPFSPLPPPQITAVFTRALRDLPTRPRVRSHSPHQAKKNPPKSYQASCLCSRTGCLCVRGRRGFFFFVRACRCMFASAGAA